MAPVTALVALLVGVAFALGLGLAGMTQPARVLAFLDVAGPWDPSLAIVMVAAVAVYAIAYRIAIRRGRPLLAPAFALPARTDVDARLVVGALVFGVGWGLAGLCPGPALTSLASGDRGALAFVTSMIAGMYAHQVVERMLARQNGSARDRTAPQETAARSNRSAPATISATMSAAGRTAVTAPTDSPA
jgi:hypothetical protein